MQYDMPLEALRDYRPDLGGIVAEGFDAFWEETLADAEARAAPTELRPHDIGLPMVEVHDLSFSGYGGQRISGWVIRPAGVSGDLPCVVQYIGYGGGRGLPEDHLHWPAAGHVVVVMDLRGQGANWPDGRGSSVTPDAEGSGGSQAHGVMTRGILSKETSYLRRLFTDAIRCAREAAKLDGVDPKRVFATGGSQGGGQALAAAAHGGVAGAFVDVPFLCHIMEAVRLVDSDPYFEIVRYLRANKGAEAKVVETISHLDALGFARKATCPALFSAALMDRIIPPRCVFAAFNHYGGEKDITVYPYGDHEGGATDQLAKQRAWLAGRL